MAWWNTQLIFQGDKLIAEGINPLSLDEYDTAILANSTTPDNGTVGEEPLHKTSSYTRVIVSGYALYGELRGYYALGVAHWQVDQSARRVFMTERSQRDQEPVSSLTSVQRGILRECLIRINPEAWDTSTGLFRQQLEF